MKEHLKQAAQGKYASIYKTKKLPFFFIETKKLTYAFTNEKTSYEETRSLSNPKHATGYYEKENGYQFWRYGLNNEESFENAQKVYSRIFTTIEDVSYSRNST